MKRKINPDIFLAAAELTERRYKDGDVYSCVNIATAAYDEFGVGFLTKGVELEEITFYHNLFGVGEPLGFTFNTMVYNSQSSDDKKFTQHDELFEMRLLALCLAYEITLCKNQKKSHR